MGWRIVVTKQPIGVVAAIASWNFERDDVCLGGIA